MSLPAPMTVAEWDKTWSAYWHAYATLDQHTRSLPWIVVQQRALPAMVRLYGERPPAPDDALWLGLVTAIRAATVAGAVAQLPAPLLAQLKTAITDHGSSPLAPEVEKLLKDVALEVGMDWAKGLWKSFRVVLIALVAGMVLAALEVLSSFFGGPEFKAWLVANVPVVGALLGNLLVPLIAGVIEAGRQAVNAWKGKYPSA